MIIFDTNIQIPTEEILGSWLTEGNLKTTFLESEILKDFPRFPWRVKF